MARVVILGGGESGCGAAVLARKQGLEAFLSDGGKLSEKYRNLLTQWGIAFEEGGHTPALILNADEVIKSPGIPDTAPIVRMVREAGIPVISEIEFAGRYMAGSRSIVITGSNGKTTTTTLIHKILADAGYDVGLAGNIGESLALQVATAPHAWYVIELSSFQLDGMFDFRADIAVLLNITPDHLDRYDYRFENYIASKLRVTQNQTADDYFIYWADDKHIQGDFAARQLPFSVNDPWDYELKIKGLHNIANAMAAALAARAAGVSEAQIRASLADFAGVEHRLEPVARIDGVEWINDSKATNVDAVWYALQSMTRPTVWIAGGTDKGNDYQPLKELAREKVKALVCLGVDNAKLVDEFTGIVPQIVETRSMKEAVQAARDLSVPGDTVLLSPACASFDLFENYEDRGRQFKQEVARVFSASQEVGGPQPSAAEGRNKDCDPPLAAT